MALTAQFRITGSVLANTSTSGIASAMFNKAGPGELYNLVSAYRGRFAHFCSIIISQNEAAGQLGTLGVNMSSWLEYATYPNGYDSSVYLGQLYDVPAYEFVRDKLEDLSYIDVVQDSNGDDICTIGSGITWNPSAESYTVNTSTTYDLCSVAKCFETLHVAFDIGITCACKPLPLIEGFPYTLPITSLI